MYNKVIAVRVFNNKTPSRRCTPEAVGSHGTHVAGTVACDFETPTVEAAYADGFNVAHMSLSGAASGIQDLLTVRDNLDREAIQTYTLDAADASANAVVCAVRGGPVTLAPGASASIQVSMAALQGAERGPHQAVLQVWAGSAVVAQAMLFTQIK